MAPNLSSGSFPGYRHAGLLGARYQITGLIAAGGMAEVYEAHDTVLDRRVAIKMLHATYGAEAEFVERFRREAMAAGRLNHANIVQVYDWGRSDEGAAYMVMELVEGTTLRQVMNDRGPMPAGEAARVAEQVCRALEVARRASIVHRDIKPENILLTREGHAKVADFGVARALAESRATQAGVVLGTASYLAPEQVEGKPGDHRSDIYSLGTVLFEMLAGAPPFRGDNPVVVAYRRVAEDVPMLRTVRSDASEQIEQVVARATARQPEARFETAGQMAAALLPLAGSAPVIVPGGSIDQTRAIPVGAAETTVIRRRVPRKRGMRMLRAVLVLLTALAMIPVGIRLFGKVEVPNVSGLTQEAASRSIERAGLKAEPLLKNHVSVPPGSVISLSPAAGAKVRRGTEITMTVSLGPAIVTMPDVRNKTLAQATAILTKANLRVAVREAFHSTPKGLVFFQDQMPNATVKEGSTIRITISKGPEQILVPAVEGKNVVDASDALKNAGFGVAVVRVANDKIARDTVISTNPSGGAKADKGSTVTVTVSDGPKEFPAPDVRGERYADAVAILTRLGLKAGRKQVPGSFGDTVVSQVPNPGRKVKRGDTMILYTA